MDNIQKMLIYCRLPVSKLYFGVSRNQRELRYIQKREKVKISIKKYGLLNPLSCGNVKDDGTYQVNRGNNCLAALIDMGNVEVNCIVCCKQYQLNKPLGKEVTVNELTDLHKNRIVKIHEIEAPECFAVELDDSVSFWNKR